MSDEYRERIMENRKYYADKHGMRRCAERRTMGAASNLRQDTAHSSLKSVNMTLAIHQEAGQWFQDFDTR